jgi:hypothetical protein
VRSPDLCQLPAGVGVVLLNVPAKKPLPPGVQLTLPMGIVLLPEIRSPWAITLKVTVLFPEVWALAVMVTGFSFAGMDGTVSGSALGKLMDDGVMVRSADESRGALIPTSALVLKAPAGAAIPQMTRTITRTGQGWHNFQLRKAALNLMDIVPWVYP